jgi:hypothetical protein
VDRALSRIHPGFASLNPGYSRRTTLISLKGRKADIAESVIETPLPPLGVDSSPALPGNFAASGCFFGLIADLRDGDGG